MGWLGVIAALLKAVPRLPSIRYSALFSLVATTYVAILGSPLTSFILAVLASLFAASLSYADSRATQSIASALRICGATPPTMRLSLYTIAIVRTLVAVLPVAIASSRICLASAVATVIAPLSLSIAVEERISVRTR